MTPFLSVVVAGGGEKERGLDCSTSPHNLAGKIAMPIINDTFFLVQRGEKGSQVVRRKGNQ